MSNPYPGRTNEAPLSASAAINQQQHNRACESCRHLKVRCLIDSTSNTAQCERCAKANRPCVFAQPQRRRTRKRMDARVAELERELNAMRLLLKKNAGNASREGQAEGTGPAQSQASIEESTANAFGGNELEEPLLKGHFNGPPDVSDTSNNAADSTNPWSPTLQNRAVSGLSVGFVDNGTSARLTTGGLVGNSLPLPEFETENDEPDVIDRGILSMDTAAQLVAVYINKLMPQYPAVLLAKETNVQEFREEKPALFLAVISAAALGGDDPDLARTLNHEVRRLYADRIFMNSDKSLELVQSILVTVAYNYPPGTAAKLQFYQFAHIAATMALDIGIGSMPPSTKLGPKYDEATAEICRTILTCHLLTAKFAFRMRRPPMLPFNNWMNEALKLLERSPLKLDQAMASWAKIRRIADEAASSFGFDDPSTHISLTQSQMQTTVKAFERRLADWKREASLDDMIYLTFEYFENQITVFEFAMEGGSHDSQEFKRSHFTLPSLDEPCPQISRPPPTSAEINATRKCIASAHGLLDYFLSLDTTAWQIIPSGYYGGAAYAIVILLKISFAIDRKTRGLEEVMDSEDLQIAYYMKMVPPRIKDAIGGPKKLRVPTHWADVMTKVQRWYEKYQHRIQERIRNISTGLDEMKGQFTTAQQVDQAPQEGLQFPGLQPYSGSATTPDNGTTPSGSDSFATGFWNNTPKTSGYPVDIGMLPQHSVEGPMIPQSNFVPGPNMPMEWKFEDYQDDSLFLEQNGLIDFGWMRGGNMLGDLPDDFGGAF